MQGLAQEEGPNVVLDYYHQNFIQLSSLQENALRVPLPAVASGVAGSGKSCVALTVLLEHVRRLHALAARDEDELEPCELLYVTESPALAEAMERDWNAHPEAQDLPKGVRVRFMTYDEVLRSESQGKTLVGRDDFDAWYKAYAEDQRMVAKVKTTHDVALDSKTVYQEFRICSAYNKEAYYALGDNIAAKERRQALYMAYEAYSKYLDEHHFIHPSFYTMRNMVSHDLVVCDESQGLSCKQLQNIIALTKEGQAVFCMDSHQSLNDKVSKNDPF